MSVIAPLVVVVVLVFMAIARGCWCFPPAIVFPGGCRRHDQGFRSRDVGTIRLPTVPAELQVAVQGWIGTGQLRLKRGSWRLLAKQHREAMTDQFRVAPGATNRTWAVVYLILGTLMGAMVAAMMAA